MPLPRPNPDESKDEWLDRCMDDAKMIAEFEGEDQRFGVCNSIWDTDERSVKVDMPDLRQVDTRPTAEMAAEARKGLELRDEWGRGGTDVGVARARDIANRENLSESTINRMVSFFARHEDNFRPDEEESDGGPTAGTIAWYLWGGSPGRTWANRKQEQFMNESNEKLPKELERRAVEFQELRVAPDSRKIEGYAAVFNSDSSPLPFIERIMPGAFDKSLAEGDDVRALFNHDPSRVLGRTTSGTLRLNSDKRGLRFAVDVPNTATGDEVLELVKRGDVSGASFGFIVPMGGDEWGEEDGRTLRNIKEARLFDVSPATYPAYPETQVSARSLEKAKELASNKEGESDSYEDIDTDTLRRRLRHRISVTNTLKGRS